MAFIIRIYNFYLCIYLFLFVCFWRILLISCEYFSTFIVLFPWFLDIRGLFEKYPTWFFPVETIEAREVEGTFMRTRGFFPASRQRQLRAASVWVRVYTQCASHCYFVRKWWNNLSSSIASNFARSLAIAKWKPFGRFSGLSETMPWASHKLRIGTTDSTMAALQWRTTLMPVGAQQAEMTSSLTKCRLLSCRTVVSLSENLQRRWG